MNIDHVGNSGVYSVVMVLYIFYNVVKCWSTELVIHCIKSTEC